MSDPPTLKRYYVSEEEYLNQKTFLEKLKSKLDHLIGALSSYKMKKNASPAAKMIADREEDKAVRIRCFKRSKENAEKFFESVHLSTHWSKKQLLRTCRWISEAQRFFLSV